MLEHRMAGLIAVVCLFAVPLTAGAQTPGPQSVVLGDKNAYLLLPPEFVAGPGVEKVAWSPTGQYVLAQRTTMRITPDLLKALMDKTSPQGPPPGEIALALYDVKAHTTVDLWKRPVGKGNVHDFRWLSGSNTALAIVDETIESNARTPGPSGKRHSLLRINGLAAFAKVISSRDSEQGREPYIMLDPSPVLPLAIVQSFVTDTASQSHNVLQVIREEGPLGKPYDLSEGAMQVHYGGWASDGISACIYKSERVDKRLVTRHYLLLDPRTAKVTEVAERPKGFESKEISGPLRLKSGNATIKEAETSRSLPALWLESVAPSDRQRTLVATGMGISQISPKFDAVLYVANGSAYVALIVPISKELYLAMEEQALRMQAISNAKQLGLGMLMYAQDYDENLPSPDGINGKLEPYLKNSDLFNGFVYTYGGGPLKDVANPSETEMGYVSGPNGNAVIYADGHVKWRRN